MEWLLNLFDAAILFAIYHPFWTLLIVILCLPIIPFLDTLKSS